MTNYHNFIRQKELFVNLSFKNIQGEQLISTFTKKLINSKEKFDTLVTTFIEAEPHEYETIVKDMIGGNEQALPEIGFKNHLEFTQNEERILNARMMNLYGYLSKLQTQNEEECK